MPEHGRNGKKNLEIIGFIIFMDEMSSWTLMSLFIQKRPIARSFFTLEYYVFIDDGIRIYSI